MSFATALVSVEEVTLPVRVIVNSIMLAVRAKAGVALNATVVCAMLALPPPAVIATAPWLVTRPFPFVVTWQTWVASPQVPGAPLTVASVIVKLAAGFVTSPVCAGSCPAAKAVDVVINVALAGIAVPFTDVVFASAAGMSVATKLWQV
jgi:hypothetical protein